MHLNFILSEQDVLINSFEADDYVVICEYFIE